MERVSGLVSDIVFRLGCAEASNRTVEYNEEKIQQVNRTTA